MCQAVREGDRRGEIVGGNCLEICEFANFGWKRRLHSFWSAYAKKNDLVQACRPEILNIFIKEITSKNPSYKRVVHAKGSKEGSPFRDRPAPIRGVRTVRGAAPDPGARGPRAAQPRRKRIRVESFPLQPPTSKRARVLPPSPRGENAVGQ